MVELKAVEKIQDVHKAQAINYLEADGLLMNFGRRFRILSIRKILFIVFKTGRKPTMTDNPLPAFEAIKSEHQP